MARSRNREKMTKMGEKKAMIPQFIYVVWYLEEFQMSVHRVEGYGNCKAENEKKTKTICK